MRKDHIDATSVSIDYASAYRLAEEREDLPGARGPAQDAIVLDAGAGHFEAPDASATDGMAFFAGVLVANGRSENPDQPTPTVHSYAVISELRAGDVFSADRVVALMEAPFPPGGDANSPGTMEITGTYFENLRVAIPQIEKKARAGAIDDSTPRFQLVNTSKAAKEPVELAFFTKTISPSRQQIKALEDMYGTLRDVSKVTDQWTTKEAAKREAHPKSTGGSADGAQSAEQRGHAVRTSMPRSGVMQLVQRLISGDLRQLVTSSQQMSSSIKPIATSGNTGGGGGGGFPG